jgi:hypothetical protein
MTLIQLKKMVDSLINNGYGDNELLMDNEPEIQFDIQFLVKGRLTDDGTQFVGVRTSSDH